MPKPALKRKPTVTIIGPGRLGTALAIALSRCGYLIESLVGRRLSKLKRSAALLDGQVQLLVAKEIHKLRSPELLIITAPDDQILFIAEALSRLKVEAGLVPTALHTSGALSSEVLGQVANRGWRIGSIHPLLSVSDPVVGAKAFKGAFWCVEGDRKATQLGRKLVRDLAGHSFSISAPAKPLYHAAAVMTSGNVVALFDVAIEMLSRCGLKRSEARRVLLPLLESTLANLTERVPARALTGTFARGDVATVERHLLALSGKGLEDARILYRLLGHKALELAKTNGLDSSIARRITKRLDA